MIKHRLFLLLSILICSWATAPADAQGSELLSGDGFRLKVTTNAAQIISASGKKMLTIDGLDMSWMPITFRGKSKITKLAANQVRVDYGNNPRNGFNFSDQMKCSAVFSCEGKFVNVKVVLTVTDKDKLQGLSTGGAMLIRQARKGKDKGLFKIGRWVRVDPGEDYEVKDGYYRQFDYGDISVWEIPYGNINWVGTWSQHIALEEITEKSTDSQTVFEGHASFFITPGKPGPESVAAQIKNQPVALSIKTDKPFNLFHIGEDKAAFKVSYFNATDNDQNIRVKTIVHDYDGNIIINDIQKLDISANGQKILDFDLPDNIPGIFFIDSGTTINGQEIFSRSTVAAKYRYTYKNKDQSIFGIAAYFPVPTREAALELMNEIGVHYLRNDDNRELPEKYGFVANFHDHFRAENFMKMSQTQKDEFFIEKLKTIKDRGNPFWEFGNENKIHEKDENVKCYVECLKTIDKLQKENGKVTKLTTIGFANGFGGIKSLQAIYKAGAWPYLDGVAYHLGRGNVMADAEVGGWDYLKSLKQVRKFIDEHGEKPLWLTEIYACNHPNDWWNDSQRLAAQNVVLTFALAMAEGVKGGLFYQLNDSVWHDVGGINPKDREYYFGMVGRNGEPKPLLLAYASAARELDGAKFVQYLKFKDKNLKGLRFDTPRGQLNILWDRSEGYGFSKKSKDFYWPEPWIKHWKKTKKVKFSSKVVGIVDSIGRRKLVRSENGVIELELNGAPLFVYGLEDAKIIN